ncbi:pantetheine-phosphate adenylyltransferase [Aestuariimicrobium kwangyangense]|uniref:pantetheine-phosphate adenylyltransferase n=1 Tax=Aestuariimicrobium kwangyangense TaxID=396389 RepID=UPI0003B3F116|nr:pantetheine-phosphate adenylyltransferase [Aestuariimicrobium kwangyangense]
MKAVCPGTFDPITLGHVDIIRRAARLFDEVIVAIGTNSTKSTLFTLDERLALCREAMTEFPAVTVAVIDGLLVDFCREHDAPVVVKGLRFGSDFDYELQMHHVNHTVGGIETVLLPGGREFGTISSTLIRNIASYGGDVSMFLSPDVNDALVERMAERRAAR